MVGEDEDWKTVELSSNVSDISENANSDPEVTSGNGRLNDNEMYII